MAVSRPSMVAVALLLGLTIAATTAAGHPFGLGNSSAQHGEQSNGNASAGDGVDVAMTVPGFVDLGIVHILDPGSDLLPFLNDHGVFLIGVLLMPGYLFGGRWRGWWDLVKMVTAFTVGHATTIVLTVLGVIAMPAIVVETGIALSIALVAVENHAMVTGRLAPTTRRRIPLLIGIGFVHGMGFADVLTDIAIPAGQRLPLLAAFNVGVELGQLLFIVPAAAGIHLLMRQMGEEEVVRSGSWPIFLIGAVWAVQRAAPVLPI